MKRTPLRRSAWIARSRTPINKVNPERRAKRRKVYQKAIHSPHWRALRAQVFAEQKGLCVCGREPMSVLDHKTYARFGRELREDVQGLGDRCNARETTSKRANWMG